MDEIKEIKNIVKPIVQEQKPLRQEVDEIKALINSGKSKKLKIPSKAKVKKGKLKKNWMGIIKIEENGNVSGTKVQIEGGAFNLGRNVNTANYHASDGRERVFWNGKFPVLIQPTWKINPINFRENASNETYGQPYIQAKMLKDAIKIKGKGGGKGIIIVLVVLVVGYILGKYVFKWF
jgi:hypothetical protein